MGVYVCVEDKTAEIAKDQKQNTQLTKTIQVMQRKVRMASSPISM